MINIYNDAVNRVSMCVTGKTNTNLALTFSDNRIVEKTEQMINKSNLVKLTK